VPDVIDLTVNLAGKILRDAGLVPRFTGGGTWVRSQSPGGGASVPRGSTVTCPTRRGPQL
jgi:beta-lactam-binding protein with PASTA domain